MNSVDGYVSDKDTAEVFANEYRQIFTSAKSDGLELEKKHYSELINNRLRSEALLDHSVCVGDVIKAIQCLIVNKGDGMKGTVSDLFIHNWLRINTIYIYKLDPNEDIVA